MVHWRLITLLLSWTKILEFYKYSTIVVNAEVAPRASINHNPIRLDDPDMIRKPLQSANIGSNDSADTRPSAYKISPPQQIEYLVRNDHMEMAQRRRRQAWSSSWRRRGRPIDVPILGLFDLTCLKGQHSGGPSEKASAYLALQHINERQFIPGHRLVMSINDTRCDAGVGVDALFHAIHAHKQRLMLLIGPASDDVTERLAQITPYFNLVQISFGTETPTLSDRESYPLFFRTVAPDSTHNDARIALLKSFNWNSVATISESNDLYTLALNELSPEMEAANITLVSTVTVEEHDMAEHLADLKAKDCRIFIGSFSPILTLQLFCEIHHLKMFGQDYAWILSGLSSGKWWKQPNNSGCTEFQILEAAQSAIFVRTHSSSHIQQESPSGLTREKFDEIFAHASLPSTDYITHAYDSVWAGAIALKKVLENYDEYSSMSDLSQMPNSAKFQINSKRNTRDERPFIRDAQNWFEERQTKWHTAQEMKAKEENHMSGLWPGVRNAKYPRRSPLVEVGYSNEQLAKYLFHEMQNLQFKGVSGPISFEGADRIGGSAFYQIQGTELHLVAVYRPKRQLLDLECPECRPVEWPEGDVPIASRVFMTRIETVGPLTFSIMASLSGIGIALAICFLVFNISYRRMKCIKLSSPHLNNMTVLGCILVYAAVIILGLDNGTMHSTRAFPAICTARAYLLSAGFSLAFGSMFTKTYRVHQLFTRTSSAGRIRNKLLQDKQLIGLVVALLIADVILVGTWAGVDPMSRELHNLSLQISPMDRGVVYQPQVEVCYSLHRSKWLGALYVYKGLLVAVGVYMAWETRHVKIPALNDSQYIGMSVYNVVITSIIVITTAHIITEHTTLSYVIVATLIITSTTTTLCLLFIPKILIITRHIDGDSVDVSLGLRIESNTRRFVLDDHREKIVRAEARNRVFKHEIAQLDAEIAHLKKLLNSQSPTLTSQSNSRFDPFKDFMKKDRPAICDLIRGTLITKYIHGDDGAVRRAKRAHKWRTMHRSLPSLSLIPTGLSQDSDDGVPDSDGCLYGIPRNVPPSPHPLQKARVVKRKLPDNLNSGYTADSVSGIIDLRYNLNFSTPQLNDFPSLLSVERFEKPRVSFSDQDHSNSSSESIVSVISCKAKSNSSFFESIQYSNPTLADDTEKFNNGDSHYSASSNFWSLSKPKKPNLNKRLVSPLMNNNHSRDNGKHFPDILADKFEQNNSSQLLEYQIKDLDVLHPDCKK